MNDNKALTTAMIIEVAPWIIGLIVLIVFWSKLKRMLSFGEPSIEEQRNQQAEVGQVPVTARNLSYTTGVYTSMANVLEQAMSGFGTDETKVKETLEKMKTQDDWNMLIRVFALREGENLLSWFRSDFDTDSWTSTDTQDLNNILIKKGIRLYLI
jgi:hypothetical protein